MRNEADGLRYLNHKVHVPRIYFTVLSLTAQYIHTAHLGTQYLSNYLLAILRRRNPFLHKNGT